MKKIEIRNKCLKHFRVFTEVFFNEINKKPFILNHHHKTLFKKGEEVVKDNLNRLIINMPPRYGKTEIMVKMFIAWSLARNPKAKFIHLSYSDSLAIDNSSQIKDIIESDLYQEFFPYVKIKPDTSAKNKWYTTAGGGVLARSSSGQVTGFGAGTVPDIDNEVELFGGAIIVDDPIKPDDANSETIRNKVNYKFNSTIRNRVNSVNTPIIIIMQRVHPEDLVGFLLDNEPDDWEVLTMPVLSENDEPLWEFKHDYEEIQKMKERLGSIFETQYMQNPQPKEGYLIPIQEIKLMPESRESELINRFVIIDPAEKNGDMMACIFVQAERLNGRINFHVFDVVFSNNGFEFVSEIVHKKAVDSNVSEIIFEKNGVGLATGIKLKELNEDNYKLTPYHTKENKEAKILNNYEFVLNYYTFASKYKESNHFRNFMQHLTTFSIEGRNTHRMDAMDVICSSAKIFKLKYKKLL